MKSTEDKPSRNRSRYSLTSLKDEKNQYETCYFTVLGMTCASCVDNIQRNLSKAQGFISTLFINFENKIIHFRYSICISCLISSTC
jgi:hypothetical protein